MLAAMISAVASFLLAATHDFPGLVAANLLMGFWFGFVLASNGKYGGGFN